VIVLGATTSTRRGGIAVVRGEGGAVETLALVEYEAADDHAEKLFHALEQAVNDAGIAKTDLARIACDVGPGSFTGIRAGTAALSAIAWSLGVPTVSVGSLEAMAFAARKQLGDVSVLTLLDARRGEVFGAVYGASAVEVEPFHHARSDEAFIAGLRQAHAAAVVGEVATTLSLVAPMARPVADLPSAAVIAEIALTREAVGSAILPAYVRAPDAKTIEERMRAGSLG
jgi:tRNA threonylcarbamoyladenosine biosynthesis protein TsaB